MSVKRYNYETDEEYYKAKDNEANDLVMWMHDLHIKREGFWKTACCIVILVNVILLYEVL